MLILPFNQSELEKIDTLIDDIARLQGNIYSIILMFTYHI